MNKKDVIRVAIEVLLLGAFAYLLLSVFWFDIGDKPSRYVFPNNDPAINQFGKVGAYAAYCIMYYFGPGGMFGLFVVCWGLGAHIIGKSVNQIVLRFVGLLLLMVAISAGWYLLWPDNEILIYHSGSFPMGNGGILGVGAGTFLLKHLAALGSTLVLICSFIVGAILLADTVVVALLKGFGHGILKLFGVAGPVIKEATEQSSQAIGDIWTRLSEKQKTTTDHLEDEQEYEEVEYEEEVEEPDDEEVEEEEEIEEEDEDETEQSQSEVGLLALDEDEQVEVNLFNLPKKKKTKKVKKKRLVPKQQKAFVQPTYDDYKLPPLELLEEPEEGFSEILSKMVEEKAQSLERLLKEFGINAHVVNAEPGPAITMYELELAPGVKVSQISNLANDMARALESGMVRVVAPLPGKHTIGIEVPNSQRETVRLKELFEKGGHLVDKMQIPIFFGKGSSGEPLVSDLAKMPHCLIAGTTGSGKSVCINTIIISILMTRRPDEVKMILVDPKMVEMAAYESLPHLMCPTITEMKRAEQILEWAVTKMDERYEFLAEAQVRNIASYNLLSEEELIERFNPSTPEEEAKIPKKLPYIVIIIDELADLMMTSAKEVESYIVRIAQKSRAVGIHLVLATQRPQATVVTGLIKANMPCRIGFRVASRMDSRIILDGKGAETLLGQGDMLFLKPGTSELIRSQGAYLDDLEIRAVVKFLNKEAQPQFHPELMQLNTVDLSGLKQDDMYDEAVRVVLESQRGSVSLLQRRLGIGYARASRIIEMMAASGLLGDYKGSQAREVTMTIDEYERMKKQMLEDEVAGYKDLTEDFDGAEEYEEDDDNDDEIEDPDTDYDEQEEEEEEEEEE